MVVVYILLGILAVLLLYICFLAICSLCVDPKKEYEKNSRFSSKSTRHFPACSHNFPKAGEARFQGRSRLFRLLGKLPYLGESRRILMAVSSKTSSKTRFCYAATRRISSAAVQPSIWA